MDIICTIAKLSKNEPTMRRLVKAGAAAFRMNLSHGTIEENVALIKLAREIIQQEKAQTKILCDLPGNKTRLGNFPELEEPLKENQTVTFKFTKTSPDLNQYIPINTESKNFIPYLEKGSILLAIDGQMGFEVLSLTEDEIQARVINAGKLGTEKGIEFGTGMDNRNHFTPKFIEQLETVKQAQPDWIAFSFVRSAKQMNQAIEYVNKLGVPNYKPQFISKIESEVAIQNIDEIAQASDMLMVARGDLGLTVPFEMLGIYQKLIVQAAKRHGKKSIVATQLLESVMTLYAPYRAEILDLTNIVLDGTDYIMFAKETGMNPKAEIAVQKARQIIDAVEKNKNLLQQEVLN